MRSLFYVLLLAGCGSEGLPAGGGDAGVDGSPNPCYGLGQQACNLRPDCRVDTCPNCQGGRDFLGCSRNSDPQTGCGLDCAAPCNILPDAASCNSRPDCHAVFEPAQACGCDAQGCCIHFDHCADGKAKCDGQPVCAIPSPICDGPYVLSYTNGCYEGCVLATECQK